MSKTTTRRAVLTIVSATATVHVLPAIAQDENDTALLALEKQIREAYRAANAIGDELGDHEAHVRLFLKECTDFGDKAAIARAQMRDNASGCAAVIAKKDRSLSVADGLAKEMWQIPARSNVGRAAKVRVLITCIMGGNEVWHGPDEDLDYHISMCRSLLIEMAGMTEEEAASLPLAADALEATGAANDEKRAQQSGHAGSRVDRPRHAVFSGARTVGASHQRGRRSRGASSASEGVAPSTCCRRAPQQTHG